VNVCIVAVRRAGLGWNVATWSRAGGDTCETSTTCPAFTEEQPVEACFGSAAITAVGGLDATVDPPLPLAVTAMRRVLPTSTVFRV
jgi:hypothetical protein